MNWFNDSYLIGLSVKKVLKARVFSKSLTSCNFIFCFCSILKRKKKHEKYKVLVHVRMFSDQTQNMSNERIIITLKTCILISKLAEEKLTTGPWATSLIGSGELKPIICTVINSANQFLLNKTKIQTSSTNAFCDIRTICCNHLQECNRYLSYFPTL